jgi:hypothetical protein
VSALLARYHALPRTMRWLLWTAAVLVLYFAVIEPYVITKPAALRAKAGETETRLVSLQKEAESGQAHVVANAIARFGPIDPPSNEPERATLLFNRKVAETLEKHGIKKYTSPNRSTNMERGPLVRAVSSDERVERRIADIQFDASPEEITGILADLERSPEITAVSKIQLRRADGGGRTLHATLTAEAWVITRKKTAR